MTDKEAEELLGHIKGHVARLRDNFDHVQIFAAKYDKEGTRHWSYGDGDYLGRIGNITIWLDRERVAEWAKEIKHD